MWYIKIAFVGDEPSEAEVEKMEDEVQTALDEAGVNYSDLAAG